MLKHKKEQNNKVNSTNDIELEAWNGRVSTRPGIGGQPLPAARESVELWLAAQEQTKVLF